MTAQDPRLIHDTSDTIVSIWAKDLAKLIWDKYVNTNNTISLEELTKDIAIAEKDLS